MHHYIFFGMDKRASFMPGKSDGPLANTPVSVGDFRIIGWQWSTSCVAVFTIYPFARTYRGLRGEKQVSRLLLAVAEALPYGAVAVVYGEMMAATAGLGFMMVVASATYQHDKAMAGLVVVVYSVALVSTILRWAAKKVLSATMSTTDPLGGYTT